MITGRPKSLYALAVIIFALMCVSLASVDPIYRKLQGDSGPIPGGNRSDLWVQLPGQFLVASATGFKEVVAGALWVRADEFFHKGQYEAILPIVRLVTWLDPHNIDVFTTGAWHLDYNFVDEEQRSDKRYIPAALALMQEGIRNNPNTYELYFELGWTHYKKKIEDNEKALYWMRKACDYEGFDPNTGKKIPRPEFVDRMVAHQYETLGMFDEAVKQWEKARKRVKKYYGKTGALPIVDKASLAVCDRNLGLFYLRRAYRYGDMDSYRKGLEIYKRLAADKGSPRDVVEDYKAASADYARRLADKQPFGDARKPLDAKFEFNWKKVGPKVLLFSGKLNFIPSSEYKGLASEVITHWYEKNQAQPAATRQLWRDGSRVYWMLTDLGYKLPTLETFDWKIDTSRTVQWDSIYVGGGTFSLLVDLSKNPEFYPFKAKKYKLTVWVKPQEPGVPDYVQDRIGWRGEALVDRHYLTITPQPDIRMTTPGFRVLKKEIILDRNDIM